MKYAALLMIVVLLAFVAYAEGWPATGGGTGGGSGVAGAKLDAMSGPIIAPVATGTCASGWYVDSDRNGSKAATEPCVNPQHTSDNDCTALTNGADGEYCWEKDANILYVCEPTAGGCDTAEEWIPVPATLSANQIPFTDVRDFGALCDGNTDDTTAFADAIDYARTSPHNIRVHVPRGNCRVSQIVLKTGTYLEGDAGGVESPSLIQQIEGSNLDMIVDDPGLADHAYLHGIVLKDLMLKSANTPGTGAGIHFSNARTGELTKFENLLIEEFTGPGIWLEGGSEPLYIENVHPFGNGNNGIYLHRGSGDINSNVTMNHISGDGNIDSLIKIETSGGSGSRETYVINGIKSECGPNQKYAVELTNMNGSPIAVHGGSLGANCVAGSAFFHIEGNIPRLSWSAIATDSTVTNWLLDDATGLNTVPKANDSRWGTFGLLVGSSHLFEWSATAPATCGSYNKGQTYYDTATAQLKTCIDDGTPAWEVTSPSTGATGPAGADGAGVLEDATHVWLKPTDDFQTACSALNTAIDAANEDGWMYVYGGTHTVTEPLVCGGVSATEQMHVICIGGPVGKNPTGAGSGCKILPNNVAGAHPTVQTGWASWDGFYIKADDDASDAAMTSTASVIVTNSSMSNPDSSNNPGPKFGLTIDATGATTPTADVHDNYFYMFCDATSECDLTAAMLRIDLGKTGNRTNNATIRNNYFDFAGNVRTADNVKPGAIRVVSGDDIYTENNTYYTLQGIDGNLYTDHPYVYSFPNLANVSTWWHNVETYLAVGSFVSSNPYGEQRIAYNGGGSGMQARSSTLMQIPNHAEAQVITSQAWTGKMFEWGVQTDGDTDWFLFPEDTPVRCTAKLEPRFNEVLGFDNDGCQNSTRFHLTALNPGAGGFSPTSSHGCPGTAPNGQIGVGYNYEGDMYFDLDKHMICVCSNIGGEWAYRGTDGTTECSTPVTTTTTTTVAPTTTTTTTLP